MERPGFQRFRRFNLTPLILIVAVASLLLSKQGDGAVLPKPDTGKLTRTTKQDSKQSDVREIKLGVPIERDLKGGESHFYKVVLTAGQYLHVVVEQKGIDVVVKLFGPDAQKVDEVDSPNGTQGPEPVSLIAEVAGEYRLEVQSFEKTAASGKYEIEMKELRPGTARDKDQIAAQRTFTEAEQLRQQGTAQSLQKAIEKYQEALPLFRNVADREGEANTLNLIGVRYWELGDNQRALEYYSQALPLWRSLGNRKEEGQVLHNFGTAYWQSGDSQKALEYYRQALPLIRAVGDRTQEAITLNTTGLAYYELGELREALNYFNQALVLLRLLENRRDEATTLLSLGSAYFKLGELQKALEYFNQALPLRRATGDRRGEAATLNNIGVLYFRLGEPQTALDYHNLALPLRRETGDRYGEVSTLHNMGVAYKWLGDQQKALNYYDQALTLARAIGDRRDEASTLQEIGVVYQSLSEWDKALEYYNQSLLLRRASGDKWAEALTLSHIGDAYTALGKPQQALSNLEQALSLQRTVGDQANEAVTLYTIAKARLGLGQLSEARSQIEAALKIVESTRSSFVSQELRSSWLVSNQSSYEFYIDLLMRMHKDQPSAENNVKAFEVSERARARGLLEILTETYSGIREGVDVSLREREQLAQQQLSIQSERLTRLLAGKHTDDQEKALKNQVEALLAEYQAVESEIRRHSPRFAALTQPEPLSSKQIQQLLDDDTLLLEYSLGEARSYVWVVTPTSIKSFELPKRAEIEDTAQRFYKTVTENENRNLPAQFEAAWALSHLILEPLANELGQKRLVIVGDGALQYVPFAALPNPEVNAARVPRRKLNSQQSAPGTYQPLIVQHEIVKLPSASVLELLRKEMISQTTPDKLVAVLADPVFQRVDQRVKRESATVLYGEAAGTASSSDNSHSDTQIRRSAWESGLEDLQRLPYSRREADAIVSLSPRGQSLKAVDFEASRAKATDGELARYRIVHFATHTLLNNQHPELSGIVLSLVDRAGNPQNGFLRLHEIYNLKLSADLVVLSGCRTALGKQVKGEGLIGLTRGFMYAGTPRVVVSLWEINDEATAELMKKLYEGMLRKRMRPAAALRAAQLEMWNGPWWKSPYYWAGFDLQGEFR